MRQLGTDPDSRIAVAAGILTVLAAAAETRAAMPVAAWTVAPTSWPVSGLSSSQTSGVDTTPAAAATMTVIFQPGDTLTPPRPSPTAHQPTASRGPFTDSKN
ncbi:hypothetical protein [Streptomyces sp. NPDC001530]|uniref:hypothetical protein n=1 Tax=Streptomyces sp. NPDC001530 TaxID=3364582 RepID=UPI00369DEDDF